MARQGASVAKRGNCMWSEAFVALRRSSRGEEWGQEHLSPPSAGKACLAAVCWDSSFTCHTDVKAQHVPS